MNNGHWFCTHCNDVKFLHSPREGEEMTKCPDCKNNSCKWVKRIPNKRVFVTSEQGAAMFGAMRAAVKGGAS